MTVEYPIRAVARLTGLSADTLRAWERRYGAVTPLRGSRGRIYSATDVQRLLRLRQAVDRGHAIGQIASLSDEGLSELLKNPVDDPQAPMPTTLHREDIPEEARPIIEAIARFDVTRADRELSRLATLLPTRLLVHDVILPLMRVVGERWHRGEFSVAQEHMASAVTRNLLGGVMRLHLPAENAKRILITTPAGEIHEFGILASAILASTMRLDVTYLGANLPGREIIDTASRTKSDVVLLGVSHPEPTQVVLDEVHVVARGLSPEIELWVGGPSTRLLLTGIRRKNIVALSDLEALETRLQEIA